MIKRGQKQDPLFLIGATASGKTGLAVRIAKEFSAEIISADSRQVYRRMDIGTGKDLFLYRQEGVGCHLIDVVGPHDEFNLYGYRQEFIKCYAKIKSCGGNAIVAGGTGLYLSAIIENYELPPAPRNDELRKTLEYLSQERLNECLLRLNPKAHNKTDLTERARTIRAIEVAQVSSSSAKNGVVMAKPVVIGIRWPMDVLRQRIETRLRERIRQGFLDEVMNLHNEGISWQRLDAFGLEYRYATLFLRGEMGFDEMVETLKIRIGQFAKRQMSWFRRMERRGQKIHWLDGDDYPRAVAIASREWQ